MKELESLTRERIGIHQEQNQHKEIKHIGTIHIKTGCKIWYYDSDKDEMKQVVVVDKGAISYTGEVIDEQKASFNPKYLYFQAINEKNARRKLAQYRRGNLSVAEDFKPKKFDTLPSYF